MKFLILEIFDRNDLEISNPWYLYDKIIIKYNYNHNFNWMIRFSNSFFSKFQLSSIRRKMIK